MFGEVWKSLEKYGQIWTSLDKSGQVLTSVDKDYQFEKLIKQITKMKKADKHNKQKIWQMRDKKKWL